MDIHLLPKFLQVELTYACNSRCSFCYNPTHHGKINKEKLEEILNSINSYEINHVQLIGGEVTLLKELPFFLSLLTKVKWRSIVTNGRVLREDIKDYINEIYISLHGDSISHEIITNELGSYKHIEANIKKYVSWGIEVNSDTVLTRYNADQIYIIAQNAHELGMKRLFLNIFQPEGIGSKRKDFSPSFEQIQAAISQMIKAKQDFGIEMFFGTSTPLCLDERLITENLAFRCGAGEWFASINPSGELRICNHSTKSYGNVSNEELHRIWHSSEIDSDYRNKVLKDQICEVCPVVQLCRGGCRINEQGNYRTDPIISRDAEKILSYSQLLDLKNKYQVKSIPSFQ